MVRAPRESTMSYCDCRDDEDAHNSKERHHHTVGDDGVEIRGRT
jgi:hypothetical protein